MNLDDSWFHMPFEIFESIISSTLPGARLRLGQLERLDRVHSLLRWRPDVFFQGFWESEDLSTRVL